MMARFLRRHRDLASCVQTGNDTEETPLAHSRAFFCARDFPRNVASKLSEPLNGSPAPCFALEICQPQMLHREPNHVYIG